MVLQGIPAQMALMGSMGNPEHLATPEHRESKARKGQKDQKVRRGLRGFAPLAPHRTRHVRWEGPMTGPE